MVENELRAAIPMFARVSDSVVRRVAAQLVVRHVEAGVELMRQGEPGDEMYVVRSGRLEVEVDGQIVRMAGRGAVVGEFVLLGAGGRTATVRATRDAELWVLSRRVFDELLVDEPTFARALIVDLSERIPQSEPAPVTVASGVLAIMAVQSGLAPAIVQAIGETLGAELCKWDPAHSVCGADWPDERLWAGQLDAAEQAARWVVLVASETAGSWRTFCERHADRMIAVVDTAAAEPAVAPRSRSGRVELAVLGGGSLPSGASSWTAQARHLIDPAAPAAGVARMARRIAGRSIGLVLSGGGARGLAHIGVLSALEDAGIEVDRLGGTSMGALIGGLAALGNTATQIHDIARSELVERHPFRDYVWPRHGLIRGVRAELMLRRLFGSELIETQRQPFFCVSSDLVAAAEVIHRTGRISDAVGLSMRLPGVAPSKWVGAQLHVDGGVLNNLPVDVIAADGEGPVIAVDVMRPFVPVSNRFGQRVPGIVDTIGRATVLGSWRKAELARKMAAVVVTPQMDGIGMFDFEQLDDIVGMGRVAAEQALAGAHLPG